MNSYPSFYDFQSTQILIGLRICYLLSFLVNNKPHVYLNTVIAATVDHYLMIIQYFCYLASDH